MQYNASPRAGLPPPGAAGGSIICQGWVLKKRRKKMQGFARRYFTLNQAGLFSYSFQPGQPSRDQVLLTQAAISTAPGRRDIHIDSGNATFHIKCLSTDDFNMWMTAIRKFLVRDRDTPTIGRRSSVRTMPRGGQYNRIGVLVDEMGNTIAELQNAFTAWNEEEGKRKSSNSYRSKSDKDRRENGKEHGGSVLGIFKKVTPHHHQHTTHDSATASISSDCSNSSSTSSYHRIQAALDALKHQHSALLKSFPISSHPSIDTSIPPSHGAHLSTTAEEDDRTQTPTTNRSAGGKITKRMSGFSSNSGGESSVWYDAQDGEDEGEGEDESELVAEGGEEFVLDPSPEEETKGSQLFDADRQSATNTETASSATSTEVAAEDSDDSDESEAEQAEDILASPGSPSHQEVVRRTQLPSGPVGDEGSLFAVLKKNVGKDLSQVALPISFNEPLTLLQKIAEELEYLDILSQATRAKDPVERMCFVAAFAVSTYANTKYRTGRKGFNPMLAETFEECRLKFIAEKVSHNPVILAYHAEGEGWELYATYSGKTKFWGKSLEIIPQGTIHLKIGNEHYQWKRPSSFMRNLMMGTKYLEHCGKMIIENTTSGRRCILDFKEGGYWGPSNVVSGTVQSPSGTTDAQLEGKWDEQMARKLDSSHLQVLWRISPFPKDAPEYYGFTSFGITLNEITPDLEGRLPPTDSRLRTDMRALEEGDIDHAEEQKRRIEEMQRDRRRSGADRRPRWFKQVGDEWIYTGGYWEKRAEGWKGIEPLW
ncbi:hypothetical protein AcW1_000457 [Taiwanofungus camphoratus]|nr:hypothetical protein AcV5_004357 [Antrodia cinnamomea]KAI0963359.1 hypothetical protein AcW1_000457 [Antrodia cinnamomea]